MYITAICPQMSQDCLYISSNNTANIPRKTNNEEKFERIQCKYRNDETSPIQIYQNQNKIK